MRSLRSAIAATLLVIGFAPAGCGPSEAEIDAANASRVAELEAQADRDLEEMLTVLADTQAAMKPRIPAPALTYDAFRGEAVTADGDEATTEAAAQAAVDEIR